MIRYRRELQSTRRKNISSRRCGRIINRRLLSIILNHSRLTRSSQSWAIIELPIFENCYITANKLLERFRYNFSLGTLSHSREIRRNPVTSRDGRLLNFRDRLINNGIRERNACRSVVVGVEVGRLCLDFRPPDAFHGSIHPS